MTAAAEDSYRLLTPDAARLYRLAGLYAWPALDAAAAARAAGLAEAEAARLLEELADALLLEHTDSGRYRYRPAVRPCRAHRRRHRRHRRVLCGRDPHRRALSAPGGGRRPGCAPGELARPDHDLADRVRRPGHRRRRSRRRRAEPGPSGARAEEFRDWDTVVRLCQALWPLQLKAGHHDILLPALQAGARTADAHFPGSRTAGSLHAQLAHTLTELRRWDEAEPEALAAARDEQAAGHTRGHASAVEFLGLLRLRQWRFTEAYDCFEEASRILDGIGPTDEGAADLPRARALLERHRGRALRGLGRRDEARDRLERALRFFRDSTEAYNTARTLTDLAETHLDGAEFTAALSLVDAAIAALGQENAAYHLAHLQMLRERCVSGG